MATELGLTSVHKHEHLPVLTESFANVQVLSCSWASCASRRAVLALSDKWLVL